MATVNRYELERLNNIPEWAVRLQDNIQQTFNGISADTDVATSGLASAGNYAPVKVANWAGTAPTTVVAALDRLAEHVSTGAGAVPIIELP